VPGGFLLSDTMEPVPAGRLLLATLVFASLYVLLVPATFVLIVAVFAWELLRWLLFSVMLVPVLFGLGVIGLAKGLIPAGLLIGVIAARTTDRLWPKLLAAALLPLVDLLLLRLSPLPRFLERGILLLMDHRALFALDTVAPLGACVLAALLVPQGLMRVLIGRRRF
jgi:hypothetical protein